jgi:hypothetical protein
VLLALLLVAGSHGARILGVFPFPSKSHMIIQRVLMLELAGSGHQVTEVTPFLEGKVVPNYTQIEVKASFATATGGRGKRIRAGNCKVAWSGIYLFKRAGNCKVICKETCVFKLLMMVSSSLISFSELQMYPFITK